MQSRDNPACKTQSGKAHACQTVCSEGHIKGFSDIGEVVPNEQFLNYLIAI